MRAGDIYAPRKIRLVEVDEPVMPAAGDGPPRILFQPELACLCGSDLPFFERDYPEFMPRVGQSLHEMIGRVVETSGERFQPGDRVLCVPVEHFGFYERYVVDEARAIPLRSEPSDEAALMAQPLGTAIFALRKLPPVIDQTVAVVGQGPMGQLFCAALRNLGARRIIALDLLDDRLEVSPRMGATHVINPANEDSAARVREITGGEMCDVVIEAVGHREQAINLCFQLCRQAARLLLFGVPCKTVDGIEIAEAFWKNLTIHTSVGPSFTSDFPLAMQWINEGRIDVSPIITHRFPVDEIQAAFDLFADRREGVLKALIEFPAT